MRTGRRVMLAVLTTVLAVSAATAQPVVVDTEVRSDGAIDRAHVLDVLGLAEGGTIDRGALRRGIRALWAMGAVDDVRVVAETAPGGLLVRVDLELRPMTGTIEVVGARWLWRRRIRDWLDLERGVPFDQSRLGRGVARVRRRLAERGYTRALVQPYADYRDATNTVDITVHVRLGAPERLAAVRVEGSEDADRAVVRAAGVDPGDIVTKDLLDRVRRRARRALMERGYWRADVAEVRREPALDGTVVRVRIDPGARYRLELDAPSDIPELQRLILRGVEDDQIHPRQPESIETYVSMHLQERGHLLARVEALREESRDGVALHVAVDPGPRTEISAVDFAGAESVPPKRLRETVVVEPGRVGGWFGQQVSRRTLEDDRVAVESVYRELGFAECRVGPPVIEPSGEASVRVVFPIEEGPRWRIAELEVVGAPIEAMIHLEGSLPMTVQGPWDPERVREARRAVVLALASSGYPEGVVDAEVDTTTPGEARVRLDVRPGPFVEIGDVLVGGLTETAESVVRGPLDEHGVRPGEPYSLESVLEARRALYELGLFRRVDISLAPGQTGGRRTVLVRCEEGRQRSYVIGLGWDTVAGPRVTVGWSHLNLLGHAHAFSTEARVSGREVRAQASLREHDLLGLGVPGRLTVYRTEEEFASFSHLSRGLWVDVGDRTRQPYRRWLRYEYKIVNPEAPQEVLSELERRRRKVRIASITPTLEWDTRDSRLNPQRGTLLSGSAALAFPAFRAEAHFLRAEGKLSLYRPLARGTAAFGLRLGVTEPLGEASSAPPNLVVPISERFFAGGPISHRAFDIDELGVPGQTIIDGEPIGGNALLLLNAEYRRPLSDLLTAVAFVDAGNVWSEPSSVDLGDVRWGLGVGLRVTTPAGPIRLEYGHKLDRKDGESAGELLLAFGTAF